MLEMEGPWKWNRFEFIKQRRTPNTYYHVSTIETIKKTLLRIGNHTLLQKFERGCLGHFIHWPKGRSSALALHMVLSRQITVDGGADHEISFRIGDRNVTFGPREFALVSGLKFGTSTFDPNSFHDPNGVDAYQVFCHNEPITLRDLMCRFCADNIIMADDDIYIKVANIIVAGYMLFGGDDRREIAPWLWVLVGNLESWDTFPWGSYAMKLLLHYINSLNMKEDQPKYHFYGPAWAIIIWAIEAIPELSTVIAREANHNTLPRCLWWSLRPRFDKDHHRIFEEGDCLRNLIPTTEERNTEYWKSVLNDDCMGVKIVVPTNPIKAGTEAVVGARRAKKRLLDLAGDRCSRRSCNHVSGEGSSATSTDQRAATDRSYHNNTFPTPDDLEGETMDNNINRGTIGSNGVYRSRDFMEEVRLMVRHEVGCELQVVLSEIFGIQQRDNADIIAARTPEPVDISIAEPEQFHSHDLNDGSPSAVTCVNGHPTEAWDSLRHPTRDNSMTCHPIHAETGDEDDEDNMEEMVRWLESLSNEGDAFNTDQCADSVVKSIVSASEVKEYYSSFRQNPNDAVVWAFNDVSLPMTQSFFQIIEDPEGFLSDEVLRMFVILRQSTLRSCKHLAPGVTPYNTILVPPTFLDMFRNAWSEIYPHDPGCTVVRNLCDYRRWNPSNEIIELINGTSRDNSIPWHHARHIITPCNVDGTHWVAIRIDLENWEVELYDSLANDVWMESQRPRGKENVRVQQIKPILRLLPRALSSAGYWDHQQRNQTHKQKYEFTLVLPTTGKMYQQSKPFRSGIYCTMFLDMLIKGTDFGQVDENVLRQHRMQLCYKFYSMAMLED